MKRRLSKCLLVASTSLCVLFAGLWIYSCGIFVDAYRLPAGGFQGRHSLYQFDARPYGINGNLDWHGQNYNLGWFTGRRHSTNDDYSYFNDIYLHGLGFTVAYLGHVTGRYDVMCMPYVAITLPYWLLMLISGLPMIFRWKRSRARKRFDRLGLCPNCGYDLRATPGRCPECGTVPAGEISATIPLAGGK